MSNALNALRKQVTALERAQAFLRKSGRPGIPRIVLRLIFREYHRMALKMLSLAGDGAFDYFTHAQVEKLARGSWFIKSLGLTPKAIRNAQIELDRRRTAQKEARNV